MGEKNQIHSQSEHILKEKGSEESKRSDKKRHCCEMIKKNMEDSIQDGCKNMYRGANIRVLALSLSHYKNI